VIRRVCQNFPVLPADLDRMTLAQVRDVYLTKEDADVLDYDDLVADLRRRLGG
jgi:hypothetical protein